MKDCHRSDETIRRLAAHQYGVVAASQARSAGLTSRQIQQRVSAGIWRRLHSGVYAIAGAGDSDHAGLLAACLAAGPEAVASHLSAAWILGLVPRSPHPHAITVPYKNRPRLRGVEVHRSRDLDPGRARLHKGIPHTDVARTLCDIAATVDGDRLISLMDRALSLGMATTAELLNESRRRSGQGRDGPGTLRDLLLSRGLIGGPEPSVLEAEALRLFRRFAIPVMKREVRHGEHGRYRIDFLITPGLAVEVDGYAYHWSPEAKAHDEARRNELRLGGLFILVYTWRDIRFDSARVAREVRSALAKLQPIA